MSHFLRSTRSPVNLLGAFVFVMAGICLPGPGSAGQLKPTSNTGARSSPDSTSRQRTAELHAGNLDSRRRAAIVA